ncbi:hypothetical protein AB7M22_001411 [Pseudomonas sp. ADAK2 TE3594]
MRGADLIGTVMGSSSESFGDFLETYERDVLPPRELGKGTLACTPSTSAASGGTSKARPLTKSHDRGNAGI